MKRGIVVWSIILVPLVILAVYVGETLTPETAGLGLGLIIGLMVAGLLVLVWAVAREERRHRERAEAMRPRPRQDFGELSRTAQAAEVVDGEWREMGVLPAPSTNASGNSNTRMLGAGEPERALVVRR